jgi:hypothetical protein
VLGGQAGAAAGVRVHIPGGFNVQRTSAVDDGQVDLPGEAVERIVAVQPREHDPVGTPGTQNALEPGPAEVGVGQRQHQHQIGALDRGTDAGDDLRIERVCEQLRVVVRDGKHDRAGLLGGQGPGGGVGHVSQFPPRSTASLVVRLACPDRLIARDAAEHKTPATRATSSNVGRRLGGVVIGSPASGSASVQNMVLISISSWKRFQKSLE